MASARSSTDDTKKKVAGHEIGHMMGFLKTIDEPDDDDKVHLHGTQYGENNILPMMWTRSIAGKNYNRSDMSVTTLDIAGLQLTKDLFWRKDKSKFISYFRATNTILKTNADIVNYTKILKNANDKINQGQ